MSEASLLMADSEKIVNSIQKFLDDMPDTFPGDRDLLHTTLVDAQTLTDAEHMIEHANKLVNDLRLTAFEHEVDADFLFRSLGSEPSHECRANCTLFFVVPQFRTTTSGDSFHVRKYECFLDVMCVFLKNFRSCAAWCGQVFLVTVEHLMKSSIDKRNFFVTNYQFASDGTGR